MARLDLRQVFPTQVQVAESDLEPPTNDGLGVLRIVRGTYDFAVQGGAISTITLLDDKGQAISIPDNAVIWDSCVDVTTTFTTAGADAGTIAIQTNAADDIVVAVAVSDGGNPWDQGLQAGLPVGTVATAIKLTAARIPSILVGGQAVTAGALVLTLIYFVGD